MGKLQPQSIEFSAYGEYTLAHWNAIRKASRIKAKQDEVKQKRYVTFLPERWRYIVTIPDWLQFLFFMCLLCFWGYHLVGGTTVFEKLFILAMMIFGGHMVWTLGSRFYDALPWIESKNYKNVGFVEVPFRLWVNDDGVGFEQNSLTSFAEWQAIERVCWFEYGVSVDGPSFSCLLIKDHFKDQAEWDACALHIYRRFNSCKKCHYNLTGSISNSCPECGDDLQKQIQKTIC